MTLLTLAATVAAGALTVDMVMVHTAHRPAAAWRTGTLHWAAEHAPGEPAVIGGSGAVAVLGLLLIVLALTPGHRGLLTIACGPRLGAAVDRRAVAALVRDAVGCLSLPPRPGPFTPRIAIKAVCPASQTAGGGRTSGGRH
ncbi:hypothetical protein JHN63_22145 [Streptomyces sp. MBT65]|uniref:hypothetical protein n=1 Tax=Streptomyces sp. MBT65 TaxID=1488395 RepID=UPI00190E21DF|nr:hypothetical protein [Streptomyces sp. MBT65]MBK3576461.1 hypothetical protein [Streptomyces sp. MBT65]